MSSYIQEIKTKFFLICWSSQPHIFHGIWAVIDRKMVQSEFKITKSSSGCWAVILNILNCFFFFHFLLVAASLLNKSVSARQRGTFTGFASWREKSKWGSPNIFTLSCLQNCNWWQKDASHNVWYMYQTALTRYLSALGFWNIEFEKSSLMN